MKLNGRLALIADKVEQANIVADIGTDHAYVPIYLVENGICKRAIASDVQEGPLKTAEANIREAGLEGLIETRLGYGLDTISENEADVIIIAGMGGTLVARILEKGKTKAESATSLILQPMNRHHEVRKWLYDNDFHIIDEELCQEGEKLYNVICARPYLKDEEKEDYKFVEFHIGKRLIEKNDELLANYVARKLRQTNRSIGEMKKSPSNIDVLEAHQNLKSELLRLEAEIQIQEKKK